jgi:hypothetical protein
VLVLGELALGLGTDSERRRVGGKALREIPFDLLELAKQLVVFGVRDRGTVKNVVLVGSAGQSVAQLLGAAKLLLAGFPRGPRSLLIGEGILGWFLPLLP